MSTSLQGTAPRRRRVSPSFVLPLVLLAARAHAQEPPTYAPSTTQEPPHPSADLTAAPGDDVTERPFVAEPDTAADDGEEARPSAPAPAHPPTARPEPAKFAPAKSASSSSASAHSAPLPAPPPTTDARALPPGVQAEEAPAPRPLFPVQAVPPDPGPPVEIAAEAGRGISFRRQDGTFAIGLRARFQLRDTVSWTAGDVSNEINIRTVRFITHGHLLTPDFRYLVQLAFGPAEYDPSSPTPIFDAFAEYVGLRDLNLRAGQFFVPFDRARTTREFALQLVDRPLAVLELNLDRDVGVMVFSQDLFGSSGRLGYALGVFGGSGRNYVGGTTPPSPLYVGRLSLRPLGPFDDDVEGDLARLPAPRLALSVAGAYNANAGRQRSTLGPSYELGGFDYVHGAADLVFKYRGLSLVGEVLYRHAARDHRDGVVDGEALREWSRSAWGYLAQGGLMLNEHVEVVARYDELRAFEGTDPALVAQSRGLGRELGAGLNLYLNGHYLKLQGDYVRRSGDGSLPVVHLARLQLDASF